MRAENKNYFIGAIWLPAIKRAGIPRSQVNGMHGLRHLRASIWLQHGVSIKAVSAYVDHADPTFTLRIYTHLIPHGEDIAIRAFNNFF